MDPIREQLLVLDEKAEQLQKSGKYGESLDVLEEILNLKRESYGENSDEYFKTSEKLCELCNLIAMICLQKEKFEASLDFLKKAEILSANSLHYKAITYNNMACYYRRTQKLRTALIQLQKALDIEIRMENPQSLADTHLNLCAVLSQLEKHDQALEHVLLSIVLLQDEYLQNVLDKQKVQENVSEQNNENPDKIKTSADDRTAVLAIAYHNMGVELEYLKRYAEAIQTYNKAVKFATENLGENHQLVDNLKNVLKAASEQIQNQKTKEKNRKEQKQAAVRNPTKLNAVSNLYANMQEQQKTRGSMGTASKQNDYNTTTGSNFPKQNSKAKYNQGQPEQAKSPYTDKQETSNKPVVKEQVIEQVITNDENEKVENETENNQM